MAADLAIAAIYKSCFSDGFSNCLQYIFVTKPHFLTFDVYPHVLGTFSVTLRKIKKQA